MQKIQFIFLLSTAYCLLPTASIAQQDAHYSHYFFNQLVYNPAYAGSEDFITTTLLFRTQWVGLAGHPITQTATAQMPLDYLHGGIGLQVSGDQLGAEATTGLMLSYAFRQTLSIGRIALGMSGGMLQKTLNGDKLRAPDGDYKNGNIIHNDAVLPVQSQSDIVPDFGVGVYFDNEHFNIGASITHLLQRKLQLDITQIQYVRNFYLMMGYHHLLNNEIAIKPSFLVQYNGTYAPQIDITTIILYNNKLWGGLSLRGFGRKNNDAIIALVGMRLKERLVVGYGFDLTLSALRQQTYGSHELILNYKFNIRAFNFGKDLHSPRFL